MTAAIRVREGAPTKARRYLVEGRLTITGWGRTFVNARCRGDGERYDLGYAHGRWWCNCAARTTGCCHLIALRLVVDRPDPPGPNVDLRAPSRANVNGSSSFPAKGRRARDTSQPPRRT